MIELAGVNYKQLLHRNKEEYLRLKDQAGKEAQKTVSAMVLTDRHRTFFNPSDPQEMEDICGIIERSQSFPDPTNPRAQFANDLLSRILARTSLQPGDLEYFSAVESNLDSFGIDGFFKLNTIKYTDHNDQEKSVRAFFDLTSDSVEGKTKKLDEKKAAKGKYLADEVLYLTGAEHYNREEHAEQINLFSKQIIQALNQHIQELKSQKVHIIRKRKEAA